MCGEPVGREICECGAYSTGLDPEKVVCGIVVRWLTINIKDCNQAAILPQYDAYWLRGDCFLMKGAMGDWVSAL